MGFFNLFPSPKIKKNELEANESDSLFSYLRRLIVTESKIQDILFNKEQIRLLDKEKRNIAYARVYMMFEEFIVSHSVPDIKRNFTREQLRKEIASTQNISLLPMDLALLFFPENKKFFTLFKIQFKPIERFLLTTFGIDKINELLDKINKEANISLQVIDGYINFKNLEEKIDKESSATDNVCLIFKIIYDICFVEIKEYFGEGSVMSLFSDIYFNVKEAYGFELLSRFVELMPKEIREKEKVSLLSRKQLEEEIRQRTEELALEKNKIEEKVKYRTRELREEKNKLAIVTENMLEGSILLNENFEVVFTNEKAQKILAFTPESEEKALLAFEDATKVNPIERLKSVIEEEKNIESTINDKIYEITFGTTESKDRTRHYLLWIRDITQFKLLENAKSEFVSVAAHQLRTPLSGTKWILHMLSKGEVGSVTDEQKSFLMKAYESNERMINLVNDLLTTEKINTKDSNYNVVPIQIFDLIENILIELKPKIEKANIKVIRERAGLPPIPADPEKMRLVFQNLLENAVKYTMSGGAVSISGEIENSFIKIRIADTGIGIPLHQQGNIFKRFYRASNAVKIQTDGSGLGLFLAKTVIEKHGGTIWFESAEGKGTAFFIKLPIVKSKK